MSVEDDYDQLLGRLTEALAQPKRKSAPDLCQAPPLPVPGQLDLAAIRRRTDLSQRAFASRIGVSLVTERKWEQGHRSPAGPARVLLALVARNPLIVAETLIDWRKAASAEGVQV
jgi:putative transcriptional regulator